MPTYPDYSKSILDKEVEDKCNKTDEGDNSSFSSFSIIQFFLGNIPAKKSFSCTYMEQSSYKPGSWDQSKINIFFSFKDAETK